MRIICIIPLFIIICFAGGLSVSGKDAVEADDAGKNYLIIRKMYYKWDQGPVGSRWYYRNELYRLLVEMIDKDVKTDYDYIPDFYDEKNHVSKIDSGKWLVLTGEISRENMKEIEVFRKKYGKQSQPGKGLFSISGRIRKFRLSEYTDKRIVYLYLDDMKLHNAGVKSQ